MTGAAKLPLPVSDVKKVRATFEALHLPSMADFEPGKAETLEPMFSFNFSLRGEEQQ